MNSERIPVIAILGHVDHGKTTILDKIRGAHVQDKEVGGITQKISAFTIDVNDKKLTFVDTPGHEAFDLMRFRGGSIADIVLLIVAANDGVKPQTEESIEIIKNSSAKPIVVINKVDLPDVDIEKIKRDLTNKGISVEGMGGSVPVVLVSGKTGQGLDTLLETILLAAEIEGLQDRGELLDGVQGKAVVLETIKDKSKGLVSSIIVLQGEFNVGDYIGFGFGDTVSLEKAKGLITEENVNLEYLKQGYGGRVLGLSSVIEPGSQLYALKEKNEKLLTSLFKKEEELIVQEEMTVDAFASLFTAEQKNEEKKSLKVVIKASSEGALEAIKKSIEKLEYEEVKAEIIESSIGDISLNDMEKAVVTKAIVLGFEVSADPGVMDLANNKRVLVRQYDIIYKLVDEVKEVLEHIGEPQETEEEIGNALIKQIFTLTNGSQVIGCRVEKGLIKKGCKVYIVRGDDIIGEARIESLRHEKDTITEAKNGIDFGAILDRNIEAIVGDSLYCYKILK